MKKVIISSMLLFFVAVAASAQTTQPTNAKVKAKPTSTVRQKVHNVVHPNHKHYSGAKVKGKAEH